jgi:hypothetical protein
MKETKIDGKTIKIDASGLSADLYNRFGSYKGTLSYEKGKWLIRTGMGFTACRGIDREESLKRFVKAYVKF